MIEKQYDQIVLSKNKIITTALIQTTESELVEVLSSIEQVQVALTHLAEYINSESSIEVITYAQSTLTIVSDKLNNILALQYAQNNQKRLDNWENEGGRVLNGRS